MSLAAGTRLGPYEVESLLGAGGMGEVYKARDTRLDRTVAIKVLPPEVASDRDRRIRFEREAKTIAALNHAHICSLHDVGDHDGCMFLVMEHLAGETLAQRLRKGPLPLEQALLIATEVADALSAAHRQGVTHRDLKPGNIMLTKAGAKLLDFGLAKLRTEAAGAFAARSVMTTELLTEKGVVLGTVPYMAPEQLEGKEADARGDIFAFGCVLYEMLTGKRAFEGASQASVITAIISAEPPPIATLQPKMPPALDRLLRRCLAKDPDTRWESAHDVADELRWIGQGVQAGGSGSTPASPRRPRRWVVVAASILFLLAVAVATLWSPRALMRLSEVRPRPPITFVAVLPLENLSNDATQEHFADGVTDSLINELAQIRALRVMSRTSVMRYKGTKKPLKDIAHELNDVGAIVEGTVMRDAGRVTVAVRVSDSASLVLWSQTYDRDMTDMLTLRREIARSVAQGIRTTLTPEDERRLSRRGTVNREAYDAYLQSVGLLARGETAAGLHAALELARNAAALDPGSAEVQAQLARANALLWWYFFDRTRERVDEARAAAARALELDPQLPSAHLAQGVVLYHLDLDYEAALREFSIAADRNPSDSDSLAYIGYVKRRQGKIQEAATAQEKALAVNPLDSNVSFNLGETYALLRRPEDADRKYDDALRQSPTYNRPLGYKIRWRLRLRPELAQAREVERRAETAGVSMDPMVLYHRVLLHESAGEHARALELLAASPVDVFEEQFWVVPVALLQGQIYDRIGERSKATEAYLRAERLIQARLRAEPDDSRCHSALGLTFAGLRDKPTALREGRMAVDEMPVTKDAYRGAYRLEDLARIYAAVGERDLAVELLGRLLTMPIDLAAPALVLEPAWAPLRGHVGFERLAVAPTGR